MSGKYDKKIRKKFNRRSSRMVKQMIEDIRSQPFLFRLKFAWLVLKRKKKQAVSDGQANH
jgi:hypothetical protein